MKQPGGRPSSTARANVNPKALTCILLSDLRLQVLRVHVGDIFLVFGRLALSAAEAAAAETAAAGENTAAHHEGLDTKERKHMVKIYKLFESDISFCLQLAK